MIPQLPVTIPRPLTGYVFYSNFASHDFRTGRVNDREGLMRVVADSFSIPLEDVWVEPFTPLADKDIIAWASYVKREHGAVVNARISRFLNILEMME